MSLYFQLSELMPTTYECWGFRRNHFGQWTRYYIAYKHKILYFFQSPNSICKKILELQNDCVFQLITMDNHPLTIKIHFKNNTDQLISIDETDAVKSLMYHFDDLKKNKL